jgi:hypothetical protein
MRPPLKAPKRLIREQGVSYCPPSLPHADAFASGCLTRTVSDGFLLCWDEGAADCGEYREVAGAGAKGIAPNQHATTCSSRISSAMAGPNRRREQHRHLIDLPQPRHAVHPEVLIRNFICFSKCYTKHTNEKIRNKSCAEWSELIFHMQRCSPRCTRVAMSAIRRKNRNLKNWR